VSAASEAMPDGGNRLKPSEAAGAGSSPNRGRSTPRRARADPVGQPRPCATLQLPPSPNVAPRRSPSNVRPERLGAASSRSTSSSSARSSWLPAVPSGNRSPPPAPPMSRGPVQTSSSSSPLAMRSAQARGSEAVGDAVVGETRQFPQGTTPSRPSASTSLPASRSGSPRRSTSAAIGRDERRVVIRTYVRMRRGLIQPTKGFFSGKA
jgi:hypothetical protein